MQLPLEQEAIRAKCFHPSGTFVEFSLEDVNTSIPERFEKIARRYPHHIAVKTGNVTTRYDQLDMMANCVAANIIRDASTSSGPVCILIDNGSDLFATMLGILKAGRFFILLDPSTPKTKISSIIRESRSSLIVYQKRHSSLVQGIPKRCRLIEIESLADSVCIANVRLPIEPSDFSTVFYTSGSTGQPKGVVHSHQSLLHMNWRSTNTLHLSPEDRIGLLSSGTSNVVTIGFRAILNGAALMIFELHKEGIAHLKQWLQEERVSVCYISAQFFRILCESLKGQNELPNLRIVRLTSEAARHSDFELYRQYFSDHCTLVNGLSSSETGVSTIYFMDKHSEIATENLPIGYPVDGVEILLLDETGRDVGFERDGEIVIRSPYLAAGYWNDPILSAAKFKQDPHEPEKWIYYTADFGVMRQDNCLIHKGRKDSRIKIRGYGVDLLEVEKALLTHSNIREAVVITDSTADGVERLIAYYVCAQQPVSTPSELRNYLHNKLTDYMIPSVFISLDKIPLTAAGKVDRRSLPKPDHARLDLSTPYTGPANESEKLLVEIWEQVLDIHPIGIHDNFFDLGGHSLAAMRVVIRVINQFRLKLPLQSLFQSPTIADMAEVITAHRKKVLDEQGLAAMLDELESMSEENAEKLLGKQYPDISKP